MKKQNYQNSIIAPIPGILQLAITGCFALSIAACGSNSNSTPVINDPVLSDPADPVFNRTLFDDMSAMVDNPFYALAPGTTFILEGMDDEGTQIKVETAVSHETRLVEGIESVIVIDREFEDGEMVEETFDWYAQDIVGNVWYMGEASTEYEDGAVVSTAGSWESGVDVENNGSIGMAGVIMKATPVVGDTYQHEIYSGVAEDRAEVVSTNAAITLMDGTSYTALQILETNPLSPESPAEHKYYVSGIGFVLEEKLDDSERLERTQTLDQKAPVIELADFSNSTTITNRYNPLIPGTIHNYEAETEDGLEKIVVEVLYDTREVMGVINVVVRDRVYLDDVLIEDTFDWFAQDNKGAVWYFGEEVINYEYDDEGNLLSTNDEGSWESGVDGALPGVQMLASPRVGDSYRQEFLAGEAEDYASIVDLDVTVTMEDGRTYNVIKTRDVNPLDPDSAAEFKYYSEGVGLVREEDVAGEEQVNLIEITMF